MMIDLYVSNASCMTNVSFYYHCGNFTVQVSVVAFKQVIAQVKGKAMFFFKVFFITYQV